MKENSCTNGFVNTYKTQRTQRADAYFSARLAVFGAVITGVAVHPHFNLFAYLRETLDAACACSDLAGRKILKLFVEFNSILWQGTHRFVQVTIEFWYPARSTEHDKMTSAV